MASKLTVDFDKMESAITAVQKALHTMQATHQKVAQALTKLDTGTKWSSTGKKRFFNDAREVQQIFSANINELAELGKLLESAHGEFSRLYDEIPKTAAPLL